MADATVTLRGPSEGQIRALGDNPLLIVPCTIDAGATYATGGNPLVLPDGIADRRLVAVILTAPNDGTRYWFWNGSTSAPLLMADDAFSTDEGNGVDVSTVDLPAILIVE